MNDKKPALLISSCLCGNYCRYDGNHNLIDLLNQLEVQYRLIPVCPEVLGGLPTPRPPAERVGQSVLTCTGVDVTKEFIEGAQRALEIALREGCTIALLKAKSPSCGCGHIYDGTFSKSLKTGNGITTELLLEHHIKVHTEDELYILLHL